MRERSLITVAGLAATGHVAELTRRIIAAWRNGLARDELKELASQSELYCGLPVMVGLSRQIEEVSDEEVSV